MQGIQLAEKFVCQLDPLFMEVPNVVRQTARHKGDAQTARATTVTTLTTVAVFGTRFGGPLDEALAMHV